MAITKKSNGKYYVQVYAGYDLNGNEQYLTADQGFSKKADAKIKEAELTKEVLENQRKLGDIKSAFVTVGNAFISSLGNTRSNSTVKIYKDYYKRYIEPYFKDYKIRDIDRITVLNFMNSFDLSPATVYKIMNILSQIFDLAVDMHIIQNNPCLGIKKPNIKRPKHSTWDEKTIASFLSEDLVRESTVYTALLILFTTGMRPGEVCGLKWQDYIFDFFKLNQGISRDRIETDLKNVYASSPVYLPPNVISHLETQKQASSDLYRAHYNKSMPQDTYICALMPDFRAMTPEHLSKQFKRLIERLGYPKITLYEARHSLGTNLMRNGVNPKIVAEILRHSSVKTTLDNYSHVDKKMYQNALAEYNKNIKIN